MQQYQQKAKRVGLLLTVLLASLGILSCVTSGGANKGSKKTSTPGKNAPSNAETTSKKENEGTTKAPVAVVAPSVSDGECKEFPQFSDEQPYFMKEHSILVTRVGAPCYLRGGKKGYDPTGGWMAMGIPCSGGVGRIDWKGTHYVRPVSVSFLLENNCPMAPGDREQTRKKGAAALGLGDQAPLLAFNPFVVQYWEIPLYGEADTSFTVDLRSHRSIDDGWTKLTKNQIPLQVSLFGRENAWVNQDALYQVDAEILWIEKNRFRLKVQSIKRLSSEEFTKVQERCERLQPRRDCKKVFSL